MIKIAFILREEMIVYVIISYRTNILTMFVYTFAVKFYNFHSFVMFK